MPGCSTPSSPKLLQTVCRWWKNEAREKGIPSATFNVLANLWHFLRDSTPGRLRQRYGDAEYDWDHRVNTTSAAVAWRDRLLGIFHSPYQPTDPALFHEMLAAVQEHTGIDFCEFDFIDFGSGKGRTLLMASDYPFRRITGVELLPSLNEIAQQNLSGYRAESQRCLDLESICADATKFPLPDRPLLLYLFNPFPEHGLRKVVANIDESLRSNARAIYVLYHNPLLESVIGTSTKLGRIWSTHQYSIYGPARR